MVPLPAPEGPSIAMMRRRLTLLLSSRMRWRRRAASLAGIAIFALVVSGAGYWAAHHYVRGAAFVVQAADLHGIARTLAEWQSGPVVEQSLTIPLARRNPSGPQISSDWHVETDVPARPGVHASGVDEPRLVGFARDLASLGHPVVTVGPPDLARYTISPAVTDAIEDAAAWLSQQRELAPDGRVGMMGISFAGGRRLSPPGGPLSATASRPSCRSAAMATCHKRSAISVRESCLTGTVCRHTTTAW